MPSQLMIFTAVPKSLSVNPLTLPVSVVASPRLQGANTLGAFPDWLAWTAQRKQHGLRITFECQGATHTTDVSRTILRPDLWEALFDEDTLVRSYRFDDYSDRFIASYPVRSAIGLLQATYQTAGVELALPTTDGDPREQEPRRRGLFKELVDGYAIKWDNASGRKWREQQRDAQRRLAGPFIGKFNRVDLAAFINDDGLFKTGTLTPGSSSFRQLQRDVVERFGIVNHQPQGVPVTRDSLDEDTVLDFHQALSSLNTYPAIQRMLGLVFDIELPVAFLPPPGTPLTAGVLRITQVDGDWNADTPTTVPVTSTGYLHSNDGNVRVFGIAPRYLIDKSEPIQVLGLLALDRTRYSVAQVDVDGGLHKTTILADSLSQSAGQSPAQHPEVFDTTTVLPSLRSGGMSLVADARALALLETFHQSLQFNQALEQNQPQPRPFCAEDLVRGFRLDVWDSVTAQWHSLHRRNATYSFGADDAVSVTIDDEEGFFQVGATQAAPRRDGTRAEDDLYLHEAIARWDGRSLSADSPGKHLTRAGDPAKAIPDAGDPDPENEPITPFKLAMKFDIVKRSLPRLRFGAAYRFRVRAVDLAGNGLTLDDEAAVRLTPAVSLPAGDRSIPYLRFEPVASPFIVLRDTRGVTGEGGEGSAVDRIVIRTFNSDPSLDESAADLTAADRHIAPPRSSVEMAERLGLFDGADGRLNASAAMWQLIKERDEGHFAEVELDTVVIDGEKQKVPLEPAARIDALPYLPDALARGAALRDLPGTPPASVGRAIPGAGAAAAIDYALIDDANPRPGSATIIEFGGRDDWQEVVPFRIALDEGDQSPQWDPVERLLTVFLPKGRTHVVPLSSCADPDDLKLMGVWQWLREYIEFVTSHQPDREFYRQTSTKDRIAHVLQLAREGGHSLLTPPHLLTFVHAVQQPLGQSAFSRLTAQLNPSATTLQTQPESAPTGATELDVLTSWRRLGSTDAYLVGALRVHGASTAKVDIHAEWTDPIDDLLADEPGQLTFSSHVDELPLPDLRERYLVAAGVDARKVAYFDADHELMCFAPGGSKLGHLGSGALVDVDAAPCHRIGDGKHHVVRYRAVSTSRYREYFPPPAAGAPPLDFTRPSEETVVYVPASTRPVAPQVRYVVPTFGWQRETHTNQKRSLRMGGGLRIYLDRPWYSSGANERLGVILSPGGAIDREEWKPFITQWGQDPIWGSAPLGDFPQSWHFTDALEREQGLPLDVLLPRSTLARTADVAGHMVDFDHDRKLWYCDLTVSTDSATFAPFVRLALARYQPHALIGAKLSRVVLADFAQLTPERAATVTADPYNAGQLRVSVSGPAPRSRPRAAAIDAPNLERRIAISVRVQQRDAAIDSDLAWASSADFTVAADPISGTDSDFILWTGAVRFTGAPRTLEADRYRLLIEEHEILAADGSDRPGRQSRLIYAETILLDASLLSAPPSQASRTTVS
jgi:hypothetical protein